MSGSSSDEGEGERAQRGRWPQSNSKSEIDSTAFDELRPRTSRGELIAGRNTKWFDQPFDTLTALSRVEGLTTLSQVEG